MGKSQNRKALTHPQLLCGSFELLEFHIGIVYLINTLSISTNFARFGRKIMKGNKE